METPATLAQLERLAAEYDAECTKLEDLVAALEADMELVRRQHITALKRQAAVVANREAELHNAIECGPQLFLKPRTFTIAGVKVGYTTSPGSLTWDDDASVVAAIREFMPRQVSTLISITEEPRKAALKALPKAEQLKIGCRLDGAGDVVVLKRVSGDVEKMISKVIEKLVAAMVAEPKPT